MNTEQRDQKRFFLNLEAKVSYRRTKEDAMTINTVAANISAGGAFLKTLHPFPMAAQIKIDFRMNYDDLKKLKFILSLDSLKQFSGGKVWISATGVVVRQEENGVGIIFDTDYQLIPMNIAKRKR
ncbi:MAG: PilZ domain-containing protein [Deltaproteobacteria bacterium]|nr:PilZ domain-containing protein [Deltaproteobacteria bacterium]